MTSSSAPTAPVSRRVLLDKSLDSYEFFAENCLKVLNKNGKLVPFVFNTPQKKIEARLNAQRAATGMVRAIILKSRRLGCSTLIAGRFYRYASLSKGQSVAIVAHVQKTSGNLYRIVKRFHEHNPIGPSVGNSNIRELIFDKLDSRYSVFSAESGEGGRGEDVRLLHISEAAYAAKLDQIMAGLAEAVPDTPGTEIILESTAKDSHGEFYEMCIAAMRGQSKYQLIFIPWTADPDAVREPEPGFEVETMRLADDVPSEQELMDQFGLTLPQIAWRRYKMNGARNLTRFRREYPLTIGDAFAAQSEATLINPSDVLKARKATPVPVGTKIFGIDPAGQGRDRFAIALRQGPAVQWVKTRKHVSVNEALAWIKSLVQEHAPERIYIDAGGGGNGSAILSLLLEDAGLGKAVRGVNFGGTSQAKMANPDKPGPTNRRSEMWGRLEAWLSGDTPVSLPDIDEVSQDLSMPKVKELNSGDWRLESKDGSISPDVGDAIALTFADRYVAQEVQIPPASADTAFTYNGTTWQKAQGWMV